MTDELDLLGGILGGVARVEAQLDGLRGEVRRAIGMATRPPPALPPMRKELPSGVSIQEVAQKVTVAAIAGERMVGTTAEEQVAKVVEALEDKRDLAMRRKRDADRRKDARNLIIGILIALAGVIFGKYLK